MRVAFGRRRRSKAAVRRRLEMSDRDYRVRVRIGAATPNLRDDLARLEEGAWSERVRILAELGAIMMARGAIPSAPFPQPVPSLVESPAQAPATASVKLAPMPANQLPEAQSADVSFAEAAPPVMPRRLGSSPSLVHSPKGARIATKLLGSLENR